ncbi:glycosyltransferase [Sphingomonas sp.]|uniref:glycosyltransferase n=1 Tax=Sphingomonas sp. TaxID=28214 RepID=UPI0025DC2D8E|nr:glycosyltransferase [Sphingomonas sp.]
MRRILHCHSTFDAGGKEARAVRLMNAFGDQFDHVILTATPGALGARTLIDPGVRADFPTDAPSLIGKPGPRRYHRLADYMRGFDLILTYNWGAMDAVMAHRVFDNLPPLIHHEDGFNADEAVRLKTRRNFFRRLALPTARALVVPSQTLEAVARGVWHITPVRIANGIDVAAYARPTVAIPGLARLPGEIVVGTLAGLRPVKNLLRLVRAAATIPNVRLVIVGEGPERAAILAEAARTGMADRLVLPGFMPRPHDYIGHFDLFALSSDSEQFPISLIEAMAAGLPCLATDVGDVATIVATANRHFVMPAEDRAFAAGLAALCGDAAIRRLLGEANRAKALAEYDERIMIGRYRMLYEAAFRDS